MAYGWIKLRQLWPAIALTILLLLVGGIIGLKTGSSIRISTTEALIKMVVVVGLFMFIGTSGIVSFGHIAFMSIGAYATTWFTCCILVRGSLMYGLPTFILHYQMPNFPAVLVSGALAATFALLIGLALMRLSGLGASIAMFAVLMMIYVGYSNWDSVTLGRSSIYGLPDYMNLWIALAWAIAAVWAAQLFQTSRFGVALIATREDEVAAKAAGISVYRMRLIGFVLSAFFVGVGGSLYAFFLQGVSTDLFYLDMTFITLAMLVVGGMNALTGAVVGTIVISTITDVLRRLEEGMTFGQTTLQIPAGSQELALAVVMLLVLVFRQQGLTGNREVPWPAWATLGKSGR